MTAPSDAARAVVRALVQLAERQPFDSEVAGVVGVRHPEHGVFLVAGGREGGDGGFALRVGGPDPVPEELASDPAEAGAGPRARDLAMLGLYVVDGSRALVLVGARAGEAELRPLEEAELQRLADVLGVLVGCTDDDALPTAPLGTADRWIGPVLHARGDRFPVVTEWFDARGAHGPFHAGRAVAELPATDVTWAVAWRELPATAARYGHSPRCLVVIERGSGAVLHSDVLDDDSPAVACDAVVALLLRGAAGRPATRPATLDVDEPGLRAALYTALADADIAIRAGKRLVVVDRIVARWDASVGGGGA